MLVNGHKMTNLGVITLLITKSRGSRPRDRGHDLSQIRGVMIRRGPDPEGHDPEGSRSGRVPIPMGQDPEITPTPRPRDPQNHEIGRFKVNTESHL